MSDNVVTRRKFIGLGLGATAGAIGASLISQAARAQGPNDYPQADHSGHVNGMGMLVGKVDHVRNGFVLRYTRVSHAI